MGINIGKEIKDGFNKIGNQVKSGVNQIGNAVKSGVNQISSAVNSGVHQLQSVQHSIQGALSKTESDITSGLHAVGDEIKKDLSAVKDAEGDVEDKLEGFVSAGKDDIVRAAVEAHDAVGKLADNTKKEIVAAAEQAKKNAEANVEVVIQAIMSKAARNALDKAVDIIEVAVPQEICLIIGPIQIYVLDMSTKIDTLQKWAHNPPDGSRESIIKIIDELAPSAIGLEFSVEFAAIFVSSDSLKVGLTLRYEPPVFLANIDQLIKDF